MMPNSRSSPVRLVITTISITLLVVLGILAACWFVLSRPPSASGPVAMNTPPSAPAPLPPAAPPPPPTVSTQPDEAPPPGFKSPAETFAPAHPPTLPPDPRFPHTAPAVSPDYFKRQKEFDAEFAGDRAITLYIDQIPGDMDGFFMKHLHELADPKASRAVLGGNRETIQFVSPDDPVKFADQVDFGYVRAINTANRTLWIQVDPRRIPTPLLPEAAVSVAPDFYARNLQDLGSWSDQRRVDALKHLAAASPHTMRNEISNAIRNLLSDAKPEIRREAIHAYAIWGDQNRILVLLPILGDPDYFTRDAAMQTVAKLHDVRAAPPLCELLESNDAGPAMRALTAMGPIAEPALLDRLDRGNDQAQRCVAEVLSSIGTSQSLPALKALAAQNAGLASLVARNAVAAIQSRMSTTSKPQ